MVILRVVACIIFFSIISGCQIDGPGKIQKLRVEKDPSAFQVVEVTSPVSTLSLTVRHMVSDDDVFVECYVPGFQFTDKSTSHTNKEGHLKISVDHQKPYSVYKAAFIIKNLKKGTHDITVSLVDSQGKTIEELNEQFTVTIP
ncbi:hypothetical protein [Bacillus sp. Marseille-Q3570]|uniref:hypothetical protein n=1 Tax=Bacillus sp. Marseille-Q3570 TaxID=2963522 RepID=UPI0021B76406|nr:hypothetical protein [Bacillus sp. Marseille-Q3570]